MSALMSLAALLAVGVLAAPPAAAEDGLVAHYTFDEGSGAIARDASGGGNDGRIHGARYQKLGRGWCLEFDGTDDFVDCGESPSLDLRGAMALEAWIHPASRVRGEPGILGKHFESYLLTYYADGKCWWYICTGGNNAKAALTPGAWHHVVATFDGATMKLYVDGKPAYAGRSAFRQANPGGRFFIGCVIGDPKASDPNYTRSSYFPGQIDEVRVYSRALAVEEVARHFAAGVARLDLTARYRPVTPAVAIRQGALGVRAGKSGDVQIDTPGGPYLLESGYSYPGETIGWNALAAPGRETRDGRRGEARPVSRPRSSVATHWAPRVTRAPGSVTVEARAGAYSLRRQVRIAGGRFLFEERVTNVSKAPIAVVVRHHLTAPKSFREAFAPGGAENPTIFLAGAAGGLGVLMEDDLSRLRVEPALGLPDNQARFRINGLALDAGKSHTLRWSLYPLPKGADYFAFMNRVRRDWGTRFTIHGPFSFFDLSSPLLNDPEGLRAYLKRRRLGIAGLSPWLDYDPGSFDHTWTRAEYKERMQKAIRALKQADPNVKCVGCIETDWVAIDPARIPGGEKLPVCGSAVTGNVTLTPEQTRILDAAGHPWKDSVKRSRDGCLTLELYMRGGKPQTALSVYPARGNSQARFLMGQVKFLLEEVGMDGFYIDEFSQGWAGGIPSYEGWDDLSAEIEPRTGKLGRRYVDCSLAGRQTRVQLCRYALDRGKIVIANSYATSQAEQALPVMRFSETQGSFDPFAVADGVEPPTVVDILRGNLATPIGLGILGVSGRRDTARRVMKAVITYLRHGALYYHYAIEDIPESGDGSGEYGPINHMYPITPVALHRGWIQGKERTVTCVSGTFTWRHPTRPAAHLFDLDGREKPHQFAIAPSGSGWKVRVDLRDWAEIAVME